MNALGSVVVQDGDPGSVLCYAPFVPETSRPGVPGDLEFFPKKIFSFVDNKVHLYLYYLVFSSPRLRQV